MYFVLKTKKIQTRFYIKHIFHEANINGFCDAILLRQVTNMPFHRKNGQLFKIAYL
jgi:hypothetical protein